MVRAHRQELNFNLGHAGDAVKRRAYQELLEHVLQVQPPADGRASDLWTPFSLFARDGRCVANVDAAVLPMVLDGAESAVIGLRSVAVHENWRGRGLFRKLMTKALTWGDTRSDGLTVLFTEDPELYEPFGFRRIRQHAFVGCCQAPELAPAPRRLDPSTVAGRATIRTMVEQRAPISSQCSLQIDPDQFLVNLTKEDPFEIALTDSADTLIVFESDDDELTLVDIVSQGRPNIPAIVGAIGRPSQRLKVLFPPDRLDWIGEPVEEDTGLMIRGVLPPALERPFMFPPTVEF